MGDDADAVDAEEGAAAVVFVVHFVEGGLHGWLEEAGEDFAWEGSGEGFFEEVHHGAGDAFGAFEEDVADEAVADGDVDVGVGEVAAFDVAAEVEAGGVAEHVEDLAGYFGAFAFFLAVAHETDDWVFDAEEVLHVDAAHDGLLEEVDGAAVDAGTGVDEEAGAVEVREGSADGGAFDAAEGAEFDGGGGDGCAGVASADDGLGAALFDEIGGDGDGAVLFLADGFDGAVVHVDDLGGVDDFDARVVEAECLHF